MALKTQFWSFSGENATSNIDEPCWQYFGMNLCPEFCKGEIETTNRWLGYICFNYLSTLRGGILIQYLPRHKFVKLFRTVLIFVKCVRNLGTCIFLFLENILHVQGNKTTQKRKLQDRPPPPPIYAFLPETIIWPCVGLWKILIWQYFREKIISNIISTLLTNPN